METSEKELIKDMLKDTLTKQIELKQPPKEEIKKFKERKVKTMLEAYLLNFFETLKDADSPDAFDKWAENKKVDDYKNKNSLCEFFQDTLSILQLNGVEYDKEKPASEFINKSLFLIAERRCEEAGVVERIKKQINDKTAKEGEPNLIDELDNKFTQEMYEEQLLREKQDVIKQVDNIEQNWDNYKDEIQKIQTDISKIKQTDLEQMSIKLNGIVDIGKDAWTLALLGILSPYTPQVVINGLEQRNAIHLLLCGDISAGKSSVSKVINQLAPVSEMFSKITEASFEGISSKDGTDEGLLDEYDRLKGKGGTLIIPEFDKFKEMPILKELMDNGLLKTMKGGNKKENDINMSMVCSANPKTDFFSKQILLRDQIDFREAVMSRFDVMIPIVNSTKKIAYLMDNMTLFGSKNNNFKLSEESMLLANLSQIMRKVKKVEISPEQQKKVIDTAKIHLKEIEKRPLVLLRDIEALCRFINTMAIAEASIRNPALNPNEPVRVTDEEVLLCCKLWEYVIDLRETVYTQATRNIMDIKEQIRLAISESGKADSRELCAKFVLDKVCSETTFYQKLKDLIVDEKIKCDGLRERTVYINA